MTGIYPRSHHYPLGSPMMMLRQYYRHGGGAGCYVVQFPGFVKIGRSEALDCRVGDHRARGATRAAAYVTGRPNIVERRALDALCRFAVPVAGTAESFTETSFEEAENVVAAVIHNIDGEWPEMIMRWEVTP